MAALLEAYITNLGKYAEGQLVGETLKFPTTAEEVQSLLKRIGVDGIRYEEIFITSFDGDVLGPSPWRTSFTDRYFDHSMGSANSEIQEAMLLRSLSSSSRLAITLSWSVRISICNCCFFNSNVGR